MRDSSPRSVLLVLLAVGLVGSVLPVAASAERATTKGVFNVNCSFSHRSSDDPIVFPRRPGATHSHDFAGNVDTDAFSTPNSLRAGVTNCEHYAPSTGRRGDQAAYWFPTLYVNGLPVTPTRVTAYYQSGDRKTSKIKPFPAQLKMIAGDASGAVDYRRLGAAFSCSTTLVPGRRTVAPTCAPGSTFVGTIRFPDCWDGRRNDSRNHKRHMAYSKWDGDGYACPRTHRVLVPQLIVENLYATVAGPTTKLSSGDVSTWHVDFMNGWKMRKQIQLVNDCLVPDLYCGGTDRPIKPLP